MMRGAWCLVLGAWCLAFAGCATDYRWRSSVPEAMRTVSVPTFRNESDVTELGAIASRQILREFQREGTFKIRSEGDAALEVQGTIKSSSVGVTGYDRRSGLRISAYDFKALVEVSVIDRRGGRVLMDNVRYTAQTTFETGQDQTTALRDASGRLMDDLSRQVVDDVLNLKW